MERTKWLVLLSRLPYPLEKGDKLRAFYQIREASKIADIHLFCLSRKSPDSKSLQALAPYCQSIKVGYLNWPETVWNFLLFFLQFLPMQCAYFYSRSAKKKLLKYAAQVKPDKVFCQLIRMSTYADYLDAPKVLDYQDAFSAGLQRRYEAADFLRKPFFSYEYYAVIRAEKKAFAKFEKSYIISDRDRQSLPLSEKEKLQIELLPNGVDLDFFTPKKVHKLYDIIFTGNMSYKPNEDAALFFLEKVLPILSGRLKKTFTVLIAGASPGEVLKKAAKQASLHYSCVVNLSGWVDSIRDCYHQANIFIAPMRLGSGMQNKLLEAMACGLPCVTTPLAAAGFGEDHAPFLVIEEKPDLWAESLSDLISQPSKAEGLGEKSRTYVEKYYSWAKHGWT